MPPKPKQLDEKHMLSLAQVGCTNEEIASHFDCSEDTIERRYAGILKKGRAQLRMSLRRSQVKKALAGDNTMLIWLGKILLGQKEIRDDSMNNNDQSAVLGKIADALQDRDGR